MPVPKRPRGRPKGVEGRGSPFTPIFDPPPEGWPHSPSIDGTDPDARIEHITRVLGMLESGDGLGIEDQALLANLLRGILSIDYRNQPGTTKSALAKALGLSAGWKDTRPSIEDRDEAMLREYEQLRSWGMDEYEHTAPEPLTSKEAIGYLVDKYQSSARRRLVDKSGTSEKRVRWGDETVERALTRARARRRKRGNL